MDNEQVKNAVRVMADLVNTFSDKGSEFAKEMSKEHNTLQQSFTKLCFQWIEHVASDKYQTDGRNEGSKKIAKEVLEAFKEKLKVEEGYTGETLEVMSKPSGYCRMI